MWAAELVEELCIDLRAVCILCPDVFQAHLRLNGLGRFNVRYLAHILNGHRMLANAVL